MQQSNPQPQSVQQNNNLIDLSLPASQSHVSNNLNESNGITFLPPQPSIQQQMQYPIQQQMQYPIQQQMSNRQRLVQLRNNYGYQQPIYRPPQNMGIFNDDQPFEENAKEMGKQGNIQIEIKAQRSQVKLGEVTILPAMCSIISSGGARTSVDLICVIDVSGSMNGQKIALVKQTMKFLIQTLTPSDRLSIITFNSSGQRICGLKAVTQENLVTFSNYINILSASGGTNIMSGMQLALKTINDRKRPNKVTSVFLLSDGQDQGAQQQLKQALAAKQNAQLGVFSIHSFGFGKDHDQDLMNKICTMKDGSFYFIKQLSTLDEAFCNALGGIISLVANEVLVYVRCIASSIAKGIRINKVYGDKWQKLNESQYRIKLTQLMSQVSKDYVFELQIPKIQGEVGDVGRQHIIVEGILSASGVQGQKMAGSTNLSIAFINSNEEIAEINQNIDVIQNYLRVKATQAIEQNMKKAEENKFEEAQAGIDKMIENITSNKRARQDKMSNLVNDLHLIRQKCQKSTYQEEGRKWMVNAQNAHSNMTNFQYANNIQCAMVQERRMYKKS